MIKCKIKDIVTLCSETLVPQKGVAYHLYSLPSFDDGMQREELLGEEILSNKFVVPDKCILFNKLNVRFKRVWRIDNADNNKLASTEFLPLIVDEDKVDFQYCYYLLISDSITKYLSGQTANTSGSHKRISPDDFLNIEVALPERTEQKKIGGFLSSIDKKIDVNRATNQKLEALTKHIYDYWFVQFDFPDENGKPYKSSGGKMVWNETLKREIPEGWEVKDIDSLCSFNDRSLTTRTMPNRMLYLDTSNLTQNYITELQELTSNFPSRARRLVQNKTILYSTVRPNQCHYGILINPENELVVSTGFATIDVNDEDVLSPYMLYSFLTTPSNVQYLHNIAVNAVSSYPSINPSDIGQMKLAIPHNTSLMKDFNSRVADIYSKINTNCNEIKHLSELRSYLLPLLMTGQAKL